MFMPLFHSIRFHYMTIPPCRLPPYHPPHALALSCKTTCLFLLPTVPTFFVWLVLCPMPGTSTLRLHLIGHQWTTDHWVELPWLAVSGARTVLGTPLPQPAIPPRCPSIQPLLPTPPPASARGNWHLPGRDLLSRRDAGLGTPLPRGCAGCAAVAAPFAHALRLPRTRLPSAAGSTRTRWPHPHRLLPHRCLLRQPAGTAHAPAGNSAPHQAVRLPLLPLRSFWAGGTRAGRRQDSGAGFHFCLRRSRVPLSCWRATYICYAPR